MTTVWTYPPENELLEGVFDTGVFDGAQFDTPDPVPIYTSPPKN